MENDDVHILLNKLAAGTSSFVHSLDETKYFVLFYQLHAISHEISFHYVLFKLQFYSMTIPTFKGMFGVIKFCNFCVYDRPGSIVTQVFPVCHVS